MEFCVPRSVCNYKVFRFELRIFNFQFVTCFVILSIRPDGNLLPEIFFPKIIILQSLEQIFFFIFLLRFKYLLFLGLDHNFVNSNSLKINPEPNAKLQQQFYEAWNIINYHKKQTKSKSSGFQFSMFNVQLKKSIRASLLMFFDTLQHIEAD